jgi:hypothetical protein
MNHGEVCVRHMQVACRNLTGGAVVVTGTWAVDSNEVDTQECEICAEADPDGDGVCEEDEDDGLD